MSIDGCLLSYLNTKRERELTKEDKQLLLELQKEFGLNSDTIFDETRESEKDQLIFLLKKARKDDDSFNTHKSLDYQNQINVLKGELQAKNEFINRFAQAIAIMEKEKERTKDLEKEVFRLINEVKQHGIGLQKIRENAIRENSVHAQVLYSLFEKHKLPDEMLLEFNERVNALFLAPSKFLIK